MVKIELPNGERVYLDRNISIEDKQKIVERLVDEWQYEIELNWDGDSIRYFLDGLANYLVWHKEDDEKGLEDRDVLSIRKIEEMVGKRKGKSVPFTSLSKPQKEILFGEKGV